MINSYRFATVAGTAYEGFEGAGAPTNWTDTSSGNTVNWDYTTAPLAGAQSLFLQDSASGSRTATYNFTDTDQFWFAFKVKQSANPAADATAFYVASDVPAALATIHISTGGNLAGYVDASGGTTVINLTPGTAYRVKARYVRGTGSNETLEVWAATEASGAWGSSLSQTNGTSTAQPGQILFDVFNTFNHDLHVDDVMQKTSDILWSELN